MTELYINMRFLTQRITGVQRFAYEICCELDKLLIDYPQLMVIGLMPKREIQTQYDVNNFSAIEIRECGRFSGHLWEQLELPWYSRGGVVLNLCNAAPIIKFRQFITLHDVIFMTSLDSHKWWFKLLYRLIAVITTKTSVGVFTVSEFSKSEIVKRLKITPDLVTVLGNAASLQRYPYVDDIFTRLNIKTQEYFLMIGSNSRRKNTSLVAKLFASNAQLSNYQLVIVGGEYLNLGAASPIFAKNILYSGYLSDGELRSLYRGAKALIFPSLYEGFGIPVIEAMAENAPVIVSDIQVMHEICTVGGVLYFEPSDAGDLERQLNCLLSVAWQKQLVGDRFTTQLINYQWTKFAKTLLKSVLKNIRY